MLSLFVFGVENCNDNVFVFRSQTTMLFSYIVYYSVLLFVIVRRVIFYKIGLKNKEQSVKRKARDKLFEISASLFFV